MPNLRLKNVADTIVSLLSNTATVARQWFIPDKDGTIAMTDDIVQLGETSSTAYRGDRGKTAFDHSQIVSGNPHGVTAGMIGASTQLTKTEKKNYYFGEFEINKTINTSTGATSALATFDVTGLIPIEPSTSITIKSKDASNITIYGWTYTSAGAAISEIRASGLIGTAIATYTFTTPSNAAYIQIYTRNGGVASPVVIGFRALLIIESAAAITYNIPVVPENYTGTDIAKIQAAIDFARWTTSPVIINGYYEISAAIIIYSNTVLEIGGRIKAAFGLRDNFIRNEAVRSTSAIKARGNTLFKLIFNGGSLEGADGDTWGGDNAPGVGGEFWRAICILLANCYNFQIDNSFIKSSNYWGITMEQSRYFVINNPKFDQDGRVANQDGINCRRGTHDGLIKNITGTTYDDMFASTNLANAQYPGGNILGDTIYEPFVTALNQFNLTVDGIDSRQEKQFPNLSPPHYGGGWLILNEDGLKSYDITIKNVLNPVAHGYIGFTTFQYWVTTQSVLGDMYNLNISDCKSPIYIRRPILNCNFFNCNDLDGTGMNKSVAIPSGSIKVGRKYNSDNYEYFDSIVSFAPTDIANCGIWFDGADVASMSLTTNLVNQWNDKSGNARHVTATLTTRPLYVAAGINRKGVVVFDGVNDALRAAKITAFQGLAGITIFMVGGRPDANTGGSVLYHGNDANNRTQNLNNYSDSNIYGSISNGGSAVGNFNVGQLTLERTDVVFDGSLSGNANRLKMWLNGLRRTLTFSGTIPATTEAHASSTFALGVIANSGAELFCPGAIAEAIIYTRALTTAEVLQVQAYLSAKWAL